MRGNTAICHRVTASEVQVTFGAFTRARRVKIAGIAKTNLYKADRWASGFAIEAEVATALTAAVSSRKTK
jgi:hypothetical protein